jgi:hypothetical protein
MNNAPNSRSAEDASGGRANAAQLSSPATVVMRRLPKRAIAQPEAVIDEIEPAARPSRTSPSVASSSPSSRLMSGMRTAHALNENPARTKNATTAARVRPTSPANHDGTRLIPLAIGGMPPSAARDAGRVGILHQTPCEWAEHGGTGTHSYPGAGATRAYAPRYISSVRFINLQSRVSAGA